MPARRSILVALLPVACLPALAQQAPASAANVSGPMTMRRLGGPQPAKDGTLPFPAVAAPRLRDALEGSYPLPARTIPDDVPQPAVSRWREQPVVIVPGANFAATRSYLHDVAAFAGPDAALLRAGLLVGRAAAALREHFPMLAVGRSLAESSKQRAAPTLVLDVRGRVAGSVHDFSAVQVEAILFDGQMRPLTRWIGEGKALPAEGRAFGFGAASDKALAEFARKWKGIVR